MTEAISIIDKLHHVLDGHDGLADRVERSLVQAHAKAQAELNPAVFDALDWPADLPAYENYLRGFLRWIPQQSGADAWKQPAPKDRFAKEVSVRLGHFFFLIDQNVDDGDPVIVENSEAFAEWLTEYTREWGKFLDTADSFDEDILDSFLRDAPEYTIGESLVEGRPNMPSGWVTFNQFFARELNAGLRPIAEPASNLVLSSPADCSFEHRFDIDGQSQIPSIEVKTTHRYGSIAQLLAGSEYGERFAGGTFVHYMLPPSAYHRFHCPVAGVVKESFVTTGRVYMQVDIEDHELKSKDNSESGYEFFQTRGVVTVDTSGSDAGDIGMVAMIPVGMSQVASVVLTVTASKNLAKGEEFGYFQFGGSDMILLFEAGVIDDVDPDKSLRHVGSIIGRCRKVTRG
ncbi:MAG: phosphatidylserine decarboxylase [Jatrophihabitans sp.]